MNTSYLCILVGLCVGFLALGMWLGSVRPMDTPKETEEYNGHGFEELWQWFGPPAAWLTLPRVLMHNMPDGWQWQMAKLLEEYRAAWRPDMVPHIETRVQGVTEKGKLVKMPDWIAEYRRPDKDFIDSLRAPIINE